MFDYTIYVFALIGFVLVSGFFAVKFGLTNTKGIIDNQRNTFTKEVIQEKKSSPILSENTLKQTNTNTLWTSDEWSVLRESVLRDHESLHKASELLDVNPRTIVSILIVEQLRLFHDNRELFKTVFAPLKILGVQSQFSWGVMGIKQETAIEIEKNLRATTSPFYLGKEYEHILDFTTTNTDEERFMRLTDEESRYYSYLYTAVYIKEIETQWKKAGYDISKRPEIISTLFNIGFIHSKPNANPHSGGAIIPIGTTTYSFGSLALEFYNSEELIDYFPRK